MKAIPILIGTTLTLAVILHDTPVAAQDLKLKIAPLTAPAVKPKPLLKNAPTLPLNKGGQGQSPLDNTAQRAIATQDLKLKTAPLTTPAVKHTPLLKNAPILPLNKGGQGQSPLDNTAQGGVAAQRLQQVKQLQQLQQATQPGTSLNQGPGGRQGQNCGIGSLNPAGCLGGAGGNRPETKPQSMHDCLSGGNSADCMVRSPGDSGPAGKARVGSGRPADGIHIPGRGQAQQDGPTAVGGWGDTHFYSYAGGHGNYRDRTNSDGTRDRETRDFSDNGDRTVGWVTTDRNGALINRDSTTIDRDGTIVDEQHGDTIDVGDGWTATRTSGTDRPSTITRIGPIAPVTPAQPDNQPTPEGSNGPANDGCDFVPGQGCRKKRADTRGMTSRPGPNGENPGAEPVRTSIAPNVGIAGAIDCGDASSDACNRGGSGLSSGGHPLDMKDPGPGAPAGGAPH
ncbi:MAG TPA: hypothetical protein ENI80_06965 [Acidiferrobacteraceae bacterium]|nr:hypothetical protein [Acidiferrobacteraceae bacterium]